MVTWLALFFFALMPPAAAQVAPSAAELAAYRGLHAAAAKGDTAEIKRLVKSGAALEARDANKRTPLHVAIFAHRAEAARALLKAGADANALDAQRYDIVTIAAVADDVEMLKLGLAGGCKAGNITSPYDGTALMAPRATPPEIVAKLNAAANAALKSERMRATLAKFGAQPRGGSPADLAAHIARERAKWTPFVAALNLKVD